MLGAAEAIRSPVFGSNWSVLRIGLRLSFDGVLASIAGSPVMMVGLCNGTTYARVNEGGGHAVAWWMPHGSLTAVTNGSYNYLSNAAGIKPYRRQGSTVTNGTEVNSATRVYSNSPTTITTGIFFEIIKGSPNWTCSNAYVSDLTGANSSLTEAQFQTIMELASLSTIATVRSGYVFQAASGSQAIDEGTYGILNNVFVYWDRTANKLTWDMRIRKVS